MEVPAKVHFKDMDDDPALMKQINRRVARLDRIFKHIITCSVLLEKSQRKTRPVSVYRLRVEMFVPPRKELVVKRQAKIDETFPAITALISDTFEAAEHELQEVKTKSLRGHMT